MGSEKRAAYDELAAQLAALIAGEPDLVANTANMGALVLGPFQGKPACVRIARGKGVCGTAASRGTAIVVPDVDEFPGHIACDAASRSELVVPLVAEGRVVGVLDLDSPRRGRFDDADRIGCERLVAILLAHHRDWPAALAGE